MSQYHATEYPTLARIALDILPIQASSVPCERLFSGGQEVATKRRAQLGAERFEEIQMTKFAWRDDIYDHAAFNSRVVEEIDEMQTYREMLNEDTEAAQWDMDEDEIVIAYT